MCTRAHTSLIFRSNTPLLRLSLSPCHCDNRHYHLGWRPCPCPGRREFFTWKRRRRALRVSGRSLFMPSLSCQPSGTADQSRMLLSSANMSWTAESGEPVSHKTSPVSCRSGWQMRRLPSLAFAQGRSPPRAVWAAARRSAVPRKSARNLPQARARSLVHKHGRQQRHTKLHL